MYEKYQPMLQKVDSHSGSFSLQEQPMSNIFQKPLVKKKITGNIYLDLENKRCEKNSKYSNKRHRKLT